MPNDDSNSGFKGQIVDKTIELIANHNEFEEWTLELLRQLMRSGEVANFNRVVEALKAKVENNP